MAKLILILDYFLCSQTRSVSYVPWISVGLRIREVLYIEFYIALCRIGRVKFNKNYIEGNVQFSRVKSVADILRIANLI